MRLIHFVFLFEREHLEGDIITTLLPPRRAADGYISKQFTFRMERFTIECHKTKTEEITTANQKKAKYL